MATAYKGKVKWFNPGKGYGFVVPDTALPGNKEAKDVFIHYSNINMNGFKTLNEGQEVSFEIGDGKGGSQAINVTPTATAAGN